MTRFPGAALVALGALLVASPARADTFELVTYTPPAGWGAQEDAGARAFVRKDAGGVGIVMVFAGRPAGPWILSVNGNAAIYQFDASGRFAYALNATTSVIQISDATALKQTAKLYHEGRYALRGNELELIRDDKPQTQRLRVRIVDEFEAGWTRGLYLLGDGDEVQ